MTIFVVALAAVAAVADDVAVLPAVPVTLTKSFNILIGFAEFITYLINSIVNDGTCICGAPATVALLLLLTLLLVSIIC